jgi:ribonuclease Z
MSLKIIFLGTSASIPTSSRGLSAVAIKREGELILFDCGEGTQRQMIKAKIGFNRNTKILISHMHGDHILGIPGLLQTMALLGRNKIIKIYGPKGIKNFVNTIMRTFKFSQIFPIKIYEIEKENKICNETEYEIITSWTNHSVPSLAYAFKEKPRPGKFLIKQANLLGIPKGPLWSRLQKGKKINFSEKRVINPEDVLGPPRKGRKIIYVGDTRPLEKIAEFSKGADILIHEATFSEELSCNAQEDMHSTPVEAALIAKKGKVGLLILTHISARYSHTDKLLEQAKNIFPNVKIAKDFDKIDVPLKE